MSFIGDALFGKPGANVQTTDIKAPVTVSNAQQGYTQTQEGLLAQKNFADALAAQNGLGNQSSVYNQLQGVANGTGPNPAQAMLAQATGNNVANQAALMAGQRGSGANAGLLARQAAMQGGALQQNAAGQGASMQANQSLNALNQLGSLANQQVANQQAGLQNYNNTAQSQYGNVLGAINAQNQAGVNMTGNINNATASEHNSNTSGVGGIIGGALSGAGLGATKAYDGGLIEQPQHMYAQGGAVKPSHAHPEVVMHLLAAGGEAPNKSMPGKKQPMFSHKPLVGEQLAAKGKVVPGKAKVKGNSIKNDTVPAVLSPKEIVLPRSVTMSDDPAGNAAKFVAAILRKKGGKL